MQLTVLVGLIFAAGVVALADESVLKGGEKMKEPSIAKVLPEVYVKYEKALSESNETNTVRASLELLSKVKGCLRQSPKSTGENQDLIAAYRATWRLCLRAMKDSKDHTVQRLIQDEWNKRLREDDDAAPSQVYALSEQWDRKLLTDEFWQLLKQTGKKKTMSAFAYVLYEHGDATDAERLMQKRKSGIDIESQAVIQNAINWMNYRLSGDKTNPGPAAATPRME